MGTLMAKATAKARNSQTWVWNGRSRPISLSRLNVYSPPGRLPLKKYRAMMPTSIRTPPAMVYRKNLMVA